MPNKTGPATSKELLLFGLLSAAMGVFVMLIVSGIIPSKPMRGGNAPPWVGVIAGSIFVLAGVALLLRWFAGGETDNGELPKGSPVWVRGVYYVMGLICVASLAGIGTWVAFGSGPRVFSTSIPLLGQGPANEWFGRGLFGAGAIVCWLFLIFATRDFWRRLRHGEPT